MTLIKTIYSLYIHCFELLVDNLNLRHDMCSSSATLQCPKWPNPFATTVPTAQHIYDVCFPGSVGQGTCHETGVCWGEKVWGEVYTRLRPPRVCWDMYPTHRSTVCKSRVTDIGHVTHKMSSRGLQMASGQQSAELDGLCHMLYQQTLLFTWFQTFLEQPLLMRAAHTRYRVNLVHSPCFTPNW